MTDRTTRGPHHPGARRRSPHRRVRGLHLLQPAPRSGGGHRPAPSSPAPARTTAAAAPGLAALLPVSPAWLEAAAGLAARFAAAYTTWSWPSHPPRGSPGCAP